MHGQKYGGGPSEPTQRHIEKHEDAREAQRHNDRQSFRGSLQAFELTAPFQVIAGRQFYLRDLGLRLLYKGSGIAAFQIDLDHKDRKSVVSGKSVSVRVDLGGRRFLKKKKNAKTQKHTHT